jgi:hypothetical protein
MKKQIKEMLKGTYFDRNTRLHEIIGTDTYFLFSDLESFYLFAY